MSQEASPERRGFLVAAGRCALVLLLGGGIGVMVLREGDECINRGICRGCSVFDACELPRALAARRTRQEEQRQARDGVRTLQRGRGTDV